MDNPTEITDALFTFSLLINLTLLGIIMLAPNEKPGKSNDES